MFRSKRAIKVDSITISGDDTERLRNLCEFIERTAQAIIDEHPYESANVQGIVTFSRNVLKEFK